MKKEQLKYMLSEFIDWARECGEDVFYVFEQTDEALDRYIEETYED